MALIPTGIVLFDLIRKQVVKKLNFEVESGDASFLCNSIYASIESVQRQTFTFAIASGAHLKILTLENNLTIKAHDSMAGRGNQMLTLPEDIDSVEVLSYGFFVSTVKGSWALYNFDGSVVRKGQSKNTWSFMCNSHGNCSYYVYKSSEDDNFHALELDKQGTGVSGTPFFQITFSAYF